MAEVITCAELFAQRDVNNAQEAAKTAKTSLTQQPDNEAVQIEWSSPVNTNEPASNDVSVGEDGTIKIGNVPPKETKSTTQRHEENQ